MNIAEIVSKVANERQTPGRFPTRLIFAHNFSDYMFLVGELKSVFNAPVSGKACMNESV